VPLTQHNADGESIRDGSGTWLVRLDRSRRTERVEFTVTRQVPPRKNGGRSIWTTRSEVPRIIALREAALEAMRGRPPLGGEISLMLQVHIPWRALYSADVCEVVHGVCVSLSRANSRSKLSPAWDTPELAPIHPSLSVAIVDSARVTFIYAQKVPYHRGESWYRVILDGER
jgi:hypothetical protein